MAYPSYVKLVEVGPRDGLQNEKQLVPTEIKLNFINKLAEAGLQHIEVTSFVSEKKVPQLADHEAVLDQLALKPVKNTTYSVLVPNAYGMEHALKKNVQEVAVFTAASDSFTQKNIDCTIEESFARFKEVITIAQSAAIPVRAYISCAIACPYEGLTAPEKVAKMSDRLLEMGCYEISIGDTIGVATPKQIENLFSVLLKSISPSKLAGHFHNTYGQALANIYQALLMGISAFDSSTSGLGGCPYAKGASGNVATEDVLYLMQGLGIETNVDMQKLLNAGQFICNALDRRPDSKNGFRQHFPNPMGI